MVALISISSAQHQLASNVHDQRVKIGLTQRGLAKRANVSLAALRKFEQKGLISLESFLKISMVLGLLENVVKATSPIKTEFSSIDDVLKANIKSTRKKGWRT